MEQHNTDKTLAIDRRQFLLLSAILMLGTFLRLHQLGAESYWFDEIITVIVSMEAESLNDLRSLGELHRQPVYFYTIFYWIKWFGTTEFVTRLPSAIAGIVAISLVYLLGKEMFNRQVSLIAAFLIAVSPFHVHYSQEARTYGFVATATLVCFYFFWQAIHKGGLGNFLLYTVSAYLLFHTHAFGLFILLSQGLYFLINWRQYHGNTRLLFGGSVLVLLLGLLPEIWPNLPGQTPDWPSPIFYLSEPSAKDIQDTIRSFVLPLHYGRSWVEVRSRYMTGLGFFAIGMLIVYFRQGGKNFIDKLRETFKPSSLPAEWRRSLLLICLWFLVPVVLPFVISKIYSPIYEGRYIINVLPALSLGLAVVAYAMRRVFPEWLALASLLLMIAPGFYDYYNLNIKEQWRHTADYVATSSQTNDLVVLAPDEDSFQKNAFAFYFEDEIEYCSIPSQVTEPDQIAAMIGECAKENERLWLVVRGLESIKAIYRNYFLEPVPDGLRLLDEQHFNSIDLYLFELE